MVGPFGDWVRYSYDDRPVLLQECDGVRILTVRLVLQPQIDSLRARTSRRARGSQGPLLWA